MAKNNTAYLEQDESNLDSEIPSPISDDDSANTSPIDLKLPLAEMASLLPSPVQADTKESPLLSPLDLKDIDSIRRFIFYLQLALHIPLQYSDTRKRDYDRPTTAEKGEVARCVALLANNIVLTAIVNRFLENWEQGDTRVLVAADWLNRTATRDTFVVGSEAWEWTRRRWIVVHGLQGPMSDRVQWTFNMPELELVEPVALVMETKEIRAARLEAERPVWEREERSITVHDLRAVIARLKQAK